MCKQIDICIMFFNLTFKDSRYVIQHVIQLLHVIIMVELVLNKFYEIFVSYFLFVLWQNLGFQ